MHYSAGLRIPRYLLTVLAVVSPLLAYGGERKLAPIVDLNPRHNEAASSSPREPNALIFEAEAVPLPTEAVPSAALQTAPKQTKLQPAVRFAAPFDPTTETPQQQTAGSVKPQTVAAKTAPVIRVYEPIRQAPRATIQNAPLAAGRAKATDELAATLTPRLEVVHRSVFLATRTDRLQRTNAQSTQPVQRPDALAARMLTTLGSFARQKPAVNSILPQSESIEQPADLKALHLSGFIQFAERDPVKGVRDVQKTDQSIASKTATQPPRQVTPLILDAVRTSIEPLPRVLATNAGKEIERTIENASSAKPTVLREKSPDLAAVLTKRSSPVVELADNPIIPQSPTIALAPQRPLVSTPKPVLKLAEEILPERPAPTEAIALETSPTIIARPVIQFADVEPLLAVLQPPPAALDLPVPTEPPALTEQQRAELEEIEAFDLDLKPIGELSARTKPEAGELPRNYAAARFAREGAIAHSMGFSRSHTETAMMWEAPAICHRPLYFEDINLERHGYKVPLIQPALSAAHFFGRVPLVPYMMVSEGHRKCQYTLGHYRPGDYAPYSLYIPRLRLDASAAEMAVVAGVIFAFP